MRIYYVLLLCVILALIIFIKPSCSVQNKDIQPFNPNTPTQAATSQTIVPSNISSNLESSITNSPSPSIVSQLPSNPPHPQITNSGPIPNPLLFNLEVTAAFSKAVYLPEDIIEIELSFTNNDTEPGIISPFPSQADILMPSLPGPDIEAQYTIQSIKAGNGSITLKPRETKTISFKWDQKKANGEQATPGWYQFYLVSMGQKASQPGTPVVLSRSTFNFLIQYPQGVLNKTIIVNQTKTISGLHIKWEDYNVTWPWFDNYTPGYDYIVDVSITLQRIELSDQGILIFASAASPDLPPRITGGNSPAYDNPWFANLPAASYSFDGAFKNARTPRGQYLDNGIFWQWGTMPEVRPLIPLDPIPDGAKELVFQIPQFGEWQGPWKFNVPLQ
jgi:hypothetical protein